MKNVDVLVTSASRPSLLITTIESFFEKTICKDNTIRMLLHEDVIRSQDSDRIIDWVNSNNLFDVLEIHNPYIGLGPSIGHMLERHIEAEYMFYLQDDWAFIREFNLDEAVRILDEYPSVNQIRYNKRKTMEYVGDNPKKRWFKKEVVFGDIILTVSPHWFLNPAIWRMSFIRDKFVPAVVHCNWRTNDVLKQGKGPNELTSDWIAENMGTFIYGKIGEPPFVQHIGYSNSALDYTGAERKYMRFKRIRFRRNEENG